MILLRTSAPWPVFGGWVATSLRNTASESPIAVTALVAVSFDPADRDFFVAVSRAWHVDSLFGELEPELAAAQSRMYTAESSLADAERSVREMAVRVAELETHLADTRHVLTAMEQTRTWRWSRRAIRFRRRSIERLRASGLFRDRDKESSQTVVQL